MPHPIYHFGVCGFVGLAFRKWLDLPVIVLVNIFVDMEVLIVGWLGVGWPVHRYAHTFLLGGLIGVSWAVVAYPLRGVFAKVMRFFNLPYKANLWKMIVSGVLGVWLHVIADAIYHWDVRIFWPSRVKPLYRLATHQQEEVICAVVLAAAVVLYVLSVRTFIKKKKLGESKQD